MRPRSAAKGPAATQDERVFHDEGARLAEEDLAREREAIQSEGAPRETRVSPPATTFDAAVQRALTDEGQTVEATWGEELFQPVQYNGMRLGGFKATTVVRPGETIAMACIRLHREMHAAAQAVFPEKARDYVKNLAEVSGMAARAVVR